MKIVKGKLIQKIKRTPSIVSFRFSFTEKIEFIPGQFSQIIFDENNPNNKELNKYLSFSSSPTKEYIEVTKRISDTKFCQKLKDLKNRDEVLFKTPLGNCVFKDEYKKIGFLIGGIGITPVISIIEYIVERNLDTDVFLVYSNRTEEEIAFRKELDIWQAEDRNIKIIYIVTDCQPKDPDCIIGRISKDLLMNKVKDLSERICFIFGPPRMVETMMNLCLDLGCSREDLRTESFVGY
jgi:ferredoxin-NADP reductase